MLSVDNTRIRAVGSARDNTRARLWGETPPRPSPKGVDDLVDSWTFTSLSAVSWQSSRDKQSSLETPVWWGMMMLSKLFLNCRRNRCSRRLLCRASTHCPQDPAIKCISSVAHTRTLLSRSRPDGPLAWRETQWPVTQWHASTCDSLRRDTERERIRETHSPYPRSIFPSDRGSRSTYLQPILLPDSLTLRHFIGRFYRLFTVSHSVRLSRFARFFYFRSIVFFPLIYA